MSHYQKPKRIKIVLILMFAGIVLASIAGVIVPYLPTGSDSTITGDTVVTGSDLTGEVVDSTDSQIAPDSILNQF